MAEPNQPPPTKKAKSGRQTHFDDAWTGQFRGIRRSNKGQYNQCIVYSYNKLEYNINN